MPQEARYVSETQILQRIANEPACRFKFTQHAIDQMEGRGIIAADVEHVLMNGQVVLIENKRDILWRARGRTVDGVGLQVVVAVFANELMIKIVTAF